MKLYLTDYIATHPDWEEELASYPYYLKISRDGRYILFMYQLVPEKSDFSLPLVRECRGIILEDKTYKPVCIPFFKFFNYGEPEAAVIDWPRATVTQKIDGSLIKLWHGSDGWHLSTNKTINAFNAEVNSVNYKSFGDVFMDAIAKYYSSIEVSNILNGLDQNLTYMFELTSQDTQVVVPYDLDVYFLGYRDNITGRECWGGHSILFNRLPRPKTYSLSSLQDVINAAAQLPYEEEGYVVFDEYFNRIKIKSPEYIKAHYLRNNNKMTWRRLIEVVMAGEESEFLTYCADQEYNIHQVKKWMIELKYHCFVAQYNVEKLCGKWLENIPKKDLAEVVNSMFEKRAYIRSYLFKAHDNPAMTWEEFTANWSASDWLKNFKVEECIT